MAITNLQLPKEMEGTGDNLIAGAPPIKYEGDMRPEMEMRQPYGLGSIVKKVLKKGKKVLDNPLVQTGLSLFPATRPYAMAYSALRNRDPISAYMAYSNMGPLGFDANNPWTGKNVLTGKDMPAMLSRITSNNQNNNVDTSAWQKALNLLLKSKNEQGEYKYNPLKVGAGALLGLGGIGMMQKAANEKQPKIEDMIGDRGSKIGLDDIQIKVQAAIDSGDKETYENLRVTENLAYLPPWEAIKRADGGRIGYAAGGQTSAEMLQMIEKLRAEGKTELEIQKILQQMFQNRLSFPRYSPYDITSASKSGPENFLDTVIAETGAGGQMPRTTDIASIAESSQITRPVSAEMSGNIRPELRGMMGAAKMDGSRLNRLNRFYQDMPKEDQGSPVSQFPEIQPYGAAQGGRIGYDDGGISTMMADLDAVKDGYSELIFGKPVHDLTPDELIELEMILKDKLGGPFGQKEMPKRDRVMAQEGGLMSLGGNEMDLRGGGFVPIGAQEKADDVPARLSKNEFVFTADAVRAAGGGDVDQGADKMYKTMKQLENRVA